MNTQEQTIHSESYGILKSIERTYSQPKESVSNKNNLRELFNVDTYNTGIDTRDIVSKLTNYSKKDIANLDNEKSTVSISHIHKLLHLEEEKELKSKLLLDKYKTNYSLKDIKPKLRLKRNIVNCISELFNYGYANSGELNLYIKPFNATRINILEESKQRYVKNPLALQNVLRYLTLTMGKKIGYGLRYDPPKGKKLYVPFTVEYDKNEVDGVFYIDQNRPLTVKNILSVEKAIKACNLTGAKVIANRVGLPAKKFVDKLNNEYHPHKDNTFELLQYDSLIKEMEL